MSSVCCARFRRDVYATSILYPAFHRDVAPCAASFFPSVVSSTSAQPRAHLDSDWLLAPHGGALAIRVPWSAPLKAGRPQPEAPAARRRRPSYRDCRGMAKAGSPISPPTVGSASGARFVFTSGSERAARGTRHTPSPPPPLGARARPNDGRGNNTTTTYRGACTIYVPGGLCRAGSMDGLRHYDTHTHKRTHVYARLMSESS
eukprot:scaffold3431_cov128-Isochrysis_galbana.AAC.1